VKIKVANCIEEQEKAAQETKLVAEQENFLLLKALLNPK
jgi:hypothetical protein